MTKFPINSILYLLSPPFLLGCLALVLLLGTVKDLSAANGVHRYAVANIPVPVLNTPDFDAVFGGKDGNTLRIDQCGQIRALEFIAMPKTVFMVLGAYRKTGQIIYRVATEEYPTTSPGVLYIDSRFVTLSAVKPPQRERTLPAIESIIERLLSAQGTPYFWGGNFMRGVPQMLLFYPPSEVTGNRDLLNRWMLSGVDCSGLLYEATDGYTPRNTSRLVNFGQPVRIAGLSTAAIVAQLKPLDLIVWNGHVMIVLDREKVIESRLGCSPGEKDGVRISSLPQTLSDIMKRRIPLNQQPFNERQAQRSFVIRRWYTQ